MDLWWYKKQWATFNQHFVSFLLSSIFFLLEHSIKHLYVPIYFILIFPCNLKSFLLVLCLIVHLSIWIKLRGRKSKWLFTFYLGQCADEPFSFAANHLKYRMRVDEYLRVEVELITFEWNSQKNCAFHLIVIGIHLIFQRKERLIFSVKKNKKFWKLFTRKNHWKLQVNRAEIVQTSGFKSMFFSKSNEFYFKINWIWFWYDENIQSKVSRIWYR